MTKVKRTKVNKAVFGGDSWFLPRMKWMDAQAIGNKGDKGEFSIMGDVGVHLRAKDEKGEGVKVPPYTQKIVECEIGKQGMMEVFLSGAPLEPAPRTGIQISQISLTTKAKKKREELVPIVNEARTVEEVETVTEKQLRKMKAKAEKAAKEKVKEEIKEEELI